MTTPLELVPITLREASAFVAAHHRHHKAPRGCRFVVGCARDSKIVGVAVVGRPSARMLDDGWTAEVTRLCVIEGERNACSLLYGACWRAARDRLSSAGHVHAPRGGRRVAARCRLDADRRGRRRLVVAQGSAARDTHPTQTKLRWERAA